MQRIFIIMLLMLMLIPSIGQCVEYSFNTSSNWQSIIQSLSGTNVVKLEDGIYTVTNWLIVKTNTTLYGTNRNGIVLTGNGTCGVVKVQGPGVRIFNLTIRDGNHSEAIEGAGISAVNGTIISNVVVSNCSARAKDGGGIGTPSGTVFVYDSIIDGCSSTNNYGGGGIRIAISNCIIRNCWSKSAGGGIAFGSATDSTIQSNYTAGAVSGGGGAFNSTLYNNNVLSSNRCVGRGGGLTSGAISGTNNIFEYNYATQYGGGRASGNVSCSNSVYRFNGAGISAGAIFESVDYNAIIQSNYANGAGAALDCKIYGSMFQGNRSTNTTANPDAGGAVNQCYTYNCIFDGNNSYNYSAIAKYYAVYNCTIINHTGNVPLVRFTNSYGFNNNIIWSNGASGTSNNIYNTTNIWNNYTNNPYFYGSYIPTHTNIIDKGNDTYAIGLTDYYNRSRIYGIHVDIGAVEWRPEDIPVTGGGNNKKKGLLAWLILGRK